MAVVAAVAGLSWCTSPFPVLEARVGGQWREEPPPAEPPCAQQKMPQSTACCPSPAAYLGVQLGQLLLVQVGLSVHALLVSKLTQKRKEEGVSVPQVPQGRTAFSSPAPERGSEQQESPQTGL